MSKVVLIPILALVLLAAVVGLVVLNPFKQTPCSSVENSLLNLREMKTFEAKGLLKTRLQTEAEEGLGQFREIEASLSFDEKIDKRDSQKPKADIDLDLSLGSEGLTIRIGANVKSFGDDIYLKITSLPNVSFLEGFDLSGIKNQWYHFKSQDLLNSSQQDSSELDEEKARALAEDMIKLFKNKTVFEIKKKLAEEKINNRKAAHYLVEVKKEGIKELVPAALELAAKYIPEQDRAKYEKDLQEFKSQFGQKFDQGWETIQPLSFDFWLDKKTCNPLKINFEKTLENNSQIKLDLQFLSFNQPFQIEKPSNAKPLDEILSSLFLPNESEQR